MVLHHRESQTNTVKEETSSVTQLCSLCMEWHTFMICIHCLLQAADSGVQRALLDALMNNTDAQAALQRGLAQQGLSINMQFLQTRANLLPPSAAAVASGRAAGTSTAFLFMCVP